MNILIDIGHPAHVHLFKNLSKKLENNGHHIFFTVRTGEKELELLNNYGLHYKKIGSRKKSISGKLLGIIFFTLKLMYISMLKKTDIYISHGSMYAGNAAFLRRKPHIALEDTGNMEQLRFSIPVSDVVITPDILGLDFGEKQITYSSYHELAYLGPNCFSPDPDIKNLLGLITNEKYCIVRFISWEASHDIGQRGFSDQDKDRLIKYLEKKMTVFIISEKELPNAYKKYKFPLKPDKLHDAIAGAEIVISEGGTIASEAGVLGIPSIYVNSKERCYNEDLSKYGLVFNFRNPDGVIEKLETILYLADYKEEFQNRRLKMLHDKIDLTSFLSWFIDIYPESIRIMKKNPDYQYNFKFKTLE